MALATLNTFVRFLVPDRLMFDTMIARAELYIGGGISCLNAEDMVLVQLRIIFVLQFAMRLSWRYVYQPARFYILTRCKDELNLGNSI